MKKAVVAGANGFVVAALLNLLSEKGIEMAAVVRNEASVMEHISNLLNEGVIYEDITSRMGGHGKYLCQRYCMA